MRGNEKLDREASAGPPAGPAAGGQRGSVADELGGIFAWLAHDDPVASRSKPMPDLRAGSACAEPVKAEAEAQPALPELAGETSPHAQLHPRVDAVGFAGNASVALVPETAPRQGEPPAPGWTSPPMMPAHVVAGTASPAMAASLSAAAVPSTISPLLLVRIRPAD